uniref:WD repeat-containing protein 63 n=1 Tax=Anopheles dirus TaxID=7168 RepID=A0A182NBD4_9DIPT
MSKVTQDVALKTGFYDDEEFEDIFGFDDEEAWNRLRSFTNTTKILLSPQLQTELEITLGKNITDEHPWRAITKEALQKCLGPALQTETELKDSLDRLEAGSNILIEYLPEQSDQEDIFLVYYDVSEINEASEIIRKLELLERLKQKVLTEKRAQQKWSGECTEEDIARWKRAPQEENVQTDAQSVLPIRRVDQTVGVRSVSSVPDGYVELLPHKWKTVNIPRKIAERGIQARPQAFANAQQTEPAFPSNAATQYLLDVGNSAIDPQLISTTWLQHSSESLSSEAQFNLIEFYRNEYDHISQKSVLAYQAPNIGEVLSFMNRSLSIGRSVCSMDWHPEWSGMFVASYTFDTVSKQASALPNPSEPSGEALNRMTFEKCAVLLWSFEETLEPLLELNSIREVTTVSFCPYDGDLLVGGLSNGQVVLWDLKGELERVELAKRTAHESSEHRKQIRQLMDYPAEESFDRGVNTAAVSSLEHSSRSAITCIKWLPRNNYCTSTGHLKVDDSKLHRFIITTSLDGSVCFWDLDFTMPALQRMIAAAKGSQLVDRTLYQRVNNLFFPTFKLICEVPILSVIVDEALYLSMPVDKSSGFLKRVKHQIEAVPVSCEMRVMLGTFNGQLIEASWEGYDFEQGTLDAVDTTKAKKTQDSDKRVPLSDRLEQKYQAKRFQTLLRQLMARRNVSPERMAREMRPVVERRKYSAEKRDAIVANNALAEVDFASAHKMLRPVEKAVVLTDETDRSKRVDKYKTDIADYRRVESEALEVLRAHYLPEMDSFEEVLKKSKEHRDRVCVNVGTNMQHLLSYENKRSSRRLGVAPRTLLEDLKPVVEVEEEEGSKHDEQFEEQLDVPKV